jgi:hypothetical protein
MLFLKCCFPVTDTGSCSECDFPVPAAASDFSQAGEIGEFMFLITFFNVRYGYIFIVFVITSNVIVTPLSSESASETAVSRDCCPSLSSYCSNTPSFEQYQASYSHLAHDEQSLLPMPSFFI